jgi:hypothetical protein
MKLQQLKSLRVGVSLLTLALIGFLFLDLWGSLTPSTARGLLYLQFVPSLLDFTDAAAMGAAGFIVVLILTTLFGRVYCSALCPLGILQDVISYLTRKIRKRPKRQFTRPHNLMRYSILALTAVLLIAGSGLLLNLLDPFSSFGRIFTNLFRPVAIGLNNAASAALEPMGGALPAPGSGWGHRAVIAGHCLGDFGASGVAGRQTWPPLLQHHLPGGGLAGPAFQSIVPAHCNQTGCLQGLYALRGGMQGGLHRQQEYDR